MQQSITDGNPKILHRHVEEADIFLDYISKAKASPLKLSCNKQTGQSAEFRSVEFLSHAAANNISQSYNGALVPNTGQAFGLNGSTFSTGERCQDGRGKGCGFVQLVERSSAENSINQLNGTVVGKQTVHLSWGENPGNKQAFSDELYMRNESQCVSGLPKSEMDIFGPVKAIGDELRLFHLELEPDKEKTQLDAIVYKKAMATC